MRTEQSFVIVGGQYSNSTIHELDQYHDTILMYQPQDSSWIELPGKLETPRANSIAIAVDISIFPQCSNVTTSTTTPPPTTESSDAAGLSATALLLLVTIMIPILRYVH